MEFVFFVSREVGLCALGGLLHPRRLLLVRGRRQHGPSAGARWEGATALLGAALRGEHGLRVVASPLPGDVMLIEWSYPRLDPDHGGIVERVGRGKEGVGRKTRPRRQCWFVRVTR